MIISVFEVDCGKILSPPIRMIYISSRPHFQGGSDHPIRIFKFYQWHLLRVYQCFTQILVNLNIHQSRWSIYHLQPYLWDILNLKSEVSNYNCRINLNWWIPTGWVSDIIHHSFILQWLCWIINTATVAWIHGIEIYDGYSLCAVSSDIFEIKPWNMRPICGDMLSGCLMCISNGWMHWSSIIVHIEQPSTCWIEVDHKLMLWW